MDGNDRAWIAKRIAQTSDMRVPDHLDIVTDTTEFMNIYRGQVLSLDGGHFLITGNVYEARFGLSDEPKYWVKKAIDLETGSRQIIKMVYYEEFRVKVGPLKIRCYRKPNKESRVLQLVRGHPLFMQGRALFDQRENEVRAIDFIQGKNLYNMILEMNTPHEEYFHTTFLEIFRKLIECFSALQLLHDNGLCHGDIRNDHIIIDQETGEYRWIDFDLTQDFSDFDVWSLGNVLQFCIGMGIRTFHEVMQAKEFPEDLKSRLTSEDASAFYGHRIMNLQKLFPYISDRLNDILLHFTINTTRFYESVSQIVTDMGEALEEYK